ncbi:MAG: hypothetical protein FK734_19300 [Asgard group archaeon]|nr:hypothetical protein [Asgard group archaeon]
MSEEEYNILKRIDELITSFSESTDAAIRFEAIQELRNYGDKAAKAIPYLIESLKNEYDYDVIFLVIEALGSYGSKAKKAVPELIDLISNYYDDEEILPLIIESLGKMGSSARDAFNPLKDIILNFHDQSIRITAMQSLERIVGSDIVDLLVEVIRNEDDIDLVRVEAIKTITKIGTNEVIELLTKTLEKVETEEIKVNIEAALGELGIDEFIPKLLTRLVDSESPYERSVAAEALGRINVKESLPVLLEACVEDPDLYVRAEAVRSLGKLKAKEATEVLIDLLHKEDDYNFLVEVIEALGKIGGEDIVQELEKILDDDINEDVRVKALQTLVEMGSESSATIILALLFEDYNTTIRKEAGKALGYIGSKVVIPELIEFITNEVEDIELLEIVKNSLLMLGAKGYASALIGLIKNCDEIEIRDKATKLIVDIDPMLAIPELIIIMEDEDPLVRSLAAFMLSSIGKKLGFSDYEQLLSAYKSDALKRNLANKQLQYEIEQKRKEILTKQKTDEAEAALQAEREANLRKIIKRYSEISLERMASLLKFKETLELEKWLLDLPDELAFKVQKDVVKIPQLLQDETVEAEEAINRIVDSFKVISNYTCHICGYPIASDFKLCPDCGEEILRCEVCKLPISLGDEIGYCSLCEAKGHLSHIQEWVKTNGNCPHCLQKISISMVVPIRTDIKKR